MNNRLDLKKKELDFLKNEEAKNPDLFVKQTYLDDNNFLENLGIYIPEKELLPTGYIKYRPEDFIVEEIDSDGFVHDVTIEEAEGAETNNMGQSVFATLIKYGLSTIEAQNDIATTLGLKNDQIQYSGLKDKDALTAQKISFRGIRPEDLNKINSPYMFLKNIEVGKGVMEKGKLRGNRFTIFIRIGPDMGNKNKMSYFLKALEQVKQNGFYNFYYIQRFGNPRLNNFYWGVSLLKGEFEKAVIGYITNVGLRENLYFKAKRESVLEVIPNWEKALKILSDLPLIFSNEIKVVKHLCNHPNDFLGAMKTIPEQVNFWVYGLSAYLFNRQISSYLKAKMEPPKEIALFLSKNKNDWLQYSDDLDAFEIFPPSFENLRHFPQIRTEGVKVKTKDSVEIHSADIIDDGIIIEFSLGKGEYATTFLSHLINLISGELPKGFSNTQIDTKKTLGKKSLEKTFKYFEPVLTSKEG